jgi:hypothetical protein
MRIATICLALAVICSVGCKPSKESGLVEKVHAKVKETVNAIEMHDLHLFITDMEIAQGKMPSKDEVRAYAKKENPKLSKLLEDGTIVLTGTRTRESVWAYEKDAPTNGGWVITNVGESKMTAEELQKALGK